MYEAERSLWLAVISQAMRDIKAPYNKIDYEKAKSWFENNTEGFNLVCDLAGLDREYIKTRAKLVIQRKHTPRRRQNHPQRAANLYQLE